MDIKKTRNMIRTFIFLSILPLSVCQGAAGGKVIWSDENSTQMYYFKLKIDKNAIGSITELLRPFANNTSPHVDELKKTTVCRNDSASAKCSCMPGFRWTDDICLSQKKCCGDSECTFPTNATQMCVSNTAVTVSGSVVLEQKYADCLTDETSDKYKKCNNKLLREMKTVFSTLRGFDTLTITGFRIGSIIADFEMTIADRIRSQDLLNKTQRLGTLLPASLNLETKGVVHLSMPPNPVCYNANITLRCTSEEDLGSQPKWNLEKLGEISDITSGTVATVKTLGPKETTIDLKEVSELWAGNYTCTYTQRQYNVTILHKARAILDVALLQNIHVSTEPTFVRCKNTKSVVKVTAKCEISKSSEPYNVTWTGNDISQKSSEEFKETKVFTAEKIVRCDSTETPHLVCIFKNRRDQSRSATVNIIFIRDGDPFCAAEGDWQDTKANFTAVLKCKDAAGLISRKCNGRGEWEEPVSGCVNLELETVLQKAKIVNTGLGFPDKNAADVFSRFENATNDTQSINSFANINASVHVLRTLDEKLTSINNETATDDFLDSCSNLLKESLDKAWKSPTTNITLAEIYLNSVEQLIEKANITGKSNKVNVEVATCNEDDCSNSVFDVNVTLRNFGSGNVKTAGFKQLGGYLPIDNESTPNSIVVSTTTNGSQDKVEITIDFPLLTPRPPNVEIKCVAWDNHARQWSSNGCKWAGAANEGRCTCEHLSSFAILMSKRPLEIPFESEITYVGLSISIMSLIISLVIELVVWGDVVKTNTLHLRHTAHVNISLCLLVGDCCFLASSKPDLSDIWCKTLTVMKHFCYLSMFFWMLCLSTMLLHQTLYLFHQVSRTNYLRFSLIVGYVGPLLIVFVTFLTNSSGAESSYYLKDTCWLVYTGLMKGSIFTFVIPVGVIVFINIFAMVVVILKLLYHQENTEKSHIKEKAAAKTVLRSVILLTPIFGVTWIFGLAVLIVDLTSQPIALIVNYTFILMNAFQGLFILLTTCLGDKMTRDALLKRLRKKDPVSTSDSIIKLDSTAQK